MFEESDSTMGVSPFSVRPLFHDSDLEQKVSSGVVTGIVNYVPNGKIAYNSRGTSLENGLMSQYISSIMNLEKQGLPYSERNKADDAIAFFIFVITRLIRKKNVRIVALPSNTPDNTEYGMLQFCEKLSKALKADFSAETLQRTEEINSESQDKTEHYYTLRVQDTKRDFRSKNILLLADVVTSGLAKAAALKKLAEEKAERVWFLALGCMVPGRAARRDFIRNPAPTIIDRYWSLFIGIVQEIKMSRDKHTDATTKNRMLLFCETVSRVDPVSAPHDITHVDLCSRS